MREGGVFEWAFAASIAAHAALLLIQFGSAAPKSNPPESRDITLILAKFEPPPAEALPVPAPPSVDPAPAPPRPKDELAERMDELLKRIDRLMKAASELAPPVPAPPAPPITATPPEDDADTAAALRVLHYARDVVAPRVRDKLDLAGLRPGRRDVVEIQIEIRRDGSLASMRIVRAAAFPELDEIARCAVAAAAPFPPLDPAIPLEAILVDCRFDFYHIESLIR